MMRKDENNTPFKLTSDVVKIIEILRSITSGVRKIPTFEADMVRKPNTTLSKISTKSSSTNLNWQNAKHAGLDQKTCVSNS